MIVESKPGAGATLGADTVAKARPDGYTLLVGAVHHAIATSVYKKLPYDFQKDFQPLTIIAMVPNVLVVSARLSDEMQKIIRTPEFRKRMAEIGAEPIGNTPEQMARQIRDETDKFARLVRQANVVID